MILAGRKIEFLHHVDARRCVCKLEVDGECVEQTAAKLHPKDKYNKSVGRKIALAKMIRRIVPRENKMEREDIWKSYFSQVRN